MILKFLSTLEIHHIWQMSYFEIITEILLSFALIFFPIYLFWITVLAQFRKISVDVSIVRYITLTNCVISWCEFGCYLNRSLVLLDGFIYRTFGLLMLNLILLRALLALQFSLISPRKISRKSFSWNILVCKFLLVNIVINSIVSYW